MKRTRTDDSAQRRIERVHRVNHLQSALVQHVAALHYDPYTRVGVPVNGFGARIIDHHGYSHEQKHYQQQRPYGRAAETHRRTKGLRLLLRQKGDKRAYQSNGQEEP